MVWGNPIRKYSTGKWTVNFDGDDMLGTNSSYTSKNYSIFAISRQTGGDNERLISSHHNWLLGYHSGINNRFYFNGWLHKGSNPADTSWHLHSVTMNSFDQGSAWKDLTAHTMELVLITIGQIQVRFGGWSNALNETSKGEVSAFLLLTQSYPMQTVEILNFIWQTNGI